MASVSAPAVNTQQARARSSTSGGPRHTDHGCNAFGHSTAHTAAPYITTAASFKIT
jgi:hypothetical protein